MDTKEFISALKAKGFRHLLIQKGSGTYVPSTIVPQGQTSATNDDTGVHVEWVVGLEGVCVYMNTINNRVTVGPALWLQVL